MTIQEKFNQLLDSNVDGTDFNYNTYLGGKENINLNGLYRDEYEGSLLATFCKLSEKLNSNITVASDDTFLGRAGSNQSSEEHLKKTQQILLKFLDKTEIEKLFIPVRVSLKKEDSGHYCLLYLQKEQRGIKSFYIDPTGLKTLDYPTNSYTKQLLSEFGLPEILPVQCQIQTVFDSSKGDLEAIQKLSPGYIGTIPPNLIISSNHCGPFVAFIIESLAEGMMNIDSQNNLLFLTEKLVISDKNFSISLGNIIRYNHAQLLTGNFSDSSLYSQAKEQLYSHFSPDRTPILESQSSNPSRRANLELQEPITARESALTPNQPEVKTSNNPPTDMDFITEIKNKFFSDLGVANEDPTEIDFSEKLAKFVADNLDKELEFKKNLLPFTNLISSTKKSTLTTKIVNGKAKLGIQGTEQFTVLPDFSSAPKIFNLFKQVILANCPDAAKMNLIKMFAKAINVNSKESNLDRSKPGTNVTVSEGTIKKLVKETEKITANKK